MATDKSVEFSHNGKNYKIRAGQVFEVRGGINYGVKPNEAQAIKQAYESSVAPAKPKAPPPASSSSINSGGGRLRNKTSIKPSTRKLFEAKTKFPLAGKYGWGKPLTITGGKNANFGWTREMRAIPGEGKVKVVKGSNSYRVGTQVDSGGVMDVMTSFKQLQHHFERTLHAITIQAEHFRIAATHRAKKVFDGSFKKRAFNSEGATNWKPLADYTVRKRKGRRKNDSLRILEEYGDLRKSIVIDNFGKITTKRVPANPTKHKLLGNCYAGWHNEGEGTYGKGWKGHPAKPYVKRQFIGHSTLLDPVIDKRMKWLVKRYLFDSVFLKVKR